MKIPQNVFHLQQGCTSLANFVVDFCSLFLNVSKDVITLLKGMNFDLYPIFCVGRLIVLSFACVALFLLLSTVQDRIRICRIRMFLGFQDRIRILQSQVRIRILPFLIKVLKRLKEWLRNIIFIQNFLTKNLILIIKHIFAILKFLNFIS